MTFGRKQYHGNDVWSNGGQLGLRGQVGPGQVGLVRSQPGPI